MLPKWEDRSIFSAHLYNPAFCGRVLHTCIKSYNNDNEQKFPFALAFLILPLILNQEIRDTLPSTFKSINNIEEWITQKTIDRETIFQTTKAFVPYTRDAIMFLCLYQKITINKNGIIITHNLLESGENSENQIQIFLKKSDMLGKILRQSGSYENIYANFNMKP